MLILFTVIGLSRPVMVFAEASATEAQPEEIAAANTARRVHVRSLAASCAACHDVTASRPGGSDDPSKIAGLAGISATDFIAKLQAFKSGERAATVMHHHAKGLNSQEIADLATYFSSQTPRKASALPSQKLLENHAN